ncbi:unnamed protein product [Mytilus coruscus]|uniref:Ig-like domain-containing protein n=1 Tax=Mytilus coruscus TaxID=42192 RepID=A0A6J8CP01_MYTCO|nr:unnamed protein product [Mytilus coruscus]
MKKECKILGVHNRFEQGVITTIHLKEAPLHSQADKTQDESASDVVLAKSKDNEQRSRGKKKQTEENQFYTPIERLSKRKKRFAHKGTTRRKRSKFLSVIFLTFSAFETFKTSDAKDLPKATILTSPIVFREDATFQCSYKCPNALSTVSTKWLKGQGKDTIIYGNTSTKGEKYTSTFSHENDIYIYNLTIHNVSVSDLDNYSCEFDFKSAYLKFTMDSKLKFIYIPDNSDIVSNISESKLNMRIPMIYPKPKCTVVFNDEDISQLIKQKDKRERTMFSTTMQMSLSGCNINVTMSCILGSRSFNWFQNISQCGNAINGKEPVSVYPIPFTVLLSLAAAVVITVILCYKCNKREGLQYHIAALQHRLRV